jgi:ferredoxin-NADP reductase
MNSIADMGAMLQSPEFQERFEDVVSGTARRNNSYIVYVDAQQRTVREYPATGEIFETSADDKMLTLLSVQGVPVSGAAAIVVPATPKRFPQPSLVAH